MTAVPHRPVSRWVGWRLRLLVGVALAGCLGIFMLAHWLGSSPSVDAQWKLTGEPGWLLTATPLPPLQPYLGHRVQALHSDSLGITMALPSPTGTSSPRWIPDHEARQRYTSTLLQLNQLLSQPEVTLIFLDGSRVQVPTTERGLQSIPCMFWLLACIALMLYLMAMALVLAKPHAGNGLFAVMTICQAINLMFLGIESRPLLGLPSAFLQHQAWLPMVMDLVTATAMVHAVCMNPRRLNRTDRWLVLAWMVCIALSGSVIRGGWPHDWWWVQAAGLCSGLTTMRLLAWSHSKQPHPFSLALKRFAFMGVIGWTGLTLSVAMSAHWPQWQSRLIPTIPMAWCVFYSSELLILPFLSRSQVLLREFILLAAVSAFATVLDLVFVVLFSLSQFASLTLALFLSLGAYAGARQWILDRVMSSQMHTTERMFEQLYRIARAVEANPERSTDLLLQLLRELFDPIELEIIDKPQTATRVVDGGSAMLVPIPSLSHQSIQQSAIALRLAHRGRRLFHSDDARLVDRIVDQLHRAVAYDRAVEQGRSEERMRLAQDLHDDIGARLLTLMYQANTPEMEAYVRHTLQDLKTLTRGLAAKEHRLSDAAAEWKTDLTQRLIAAGVHLHWIAFFDEDILLTVVQWSAVTRVLRELISNVLSHSQARRVEVSLTLKDGRLKITVTDDGVGSAPQNWAHGLGLGGVRKRVKQLGGEVKWLGMPGGGIRCKVTVDHFSTP